MALRAIYFQAIIYGDPVDGDVGGPQYVVHPSLVKYWELTAGINFGAGRGALLQAFSVYSPSSGTRLTLQHE